MPVREFYWDGTSWGNDEPGFILGVTEPTRYNTGAGTDGFPVPATTINGNVTVTSGQVLRDTVIYGYVRLHVGGSLINCVVTGPATAEKEISLITVNVPSDWNGTDQAIIDHCTLQPQEPYRSQGFSSAVGIRAYRITRSLVLDLLDGFSISGGLTSDVSMPPNVYIGGCYVSDLTALSPDPWIPAFAGTHNDIIQHHGARVDYDASSVTLVGNSFDARPSASSNVTLAEILDGSKGVGMVGIMHSKGTGVYSATHLDRNWMRGGNQTMQSADSTITATLVVTGNRWERGTADGGSPADGLPQVSSYLSRTSLGGSTTPRLTWTDNVWLSGGAASPILFNP